MKKPDSLEAAKPKTIRGKYVHLLEQGTNIAVIDRDIVDRFPDSASVNKALRAFLAMGEQFATLTSSPQPRVRRAAGVKTLAFDPRSGRKNQVAVATR